MTIAAELAFRSSARVKNSLRRRLHKANTNSLNG